jgi:hypothetical protein
MFSPCFCKISFAVDISQGGIEGGKVNRLTGEEGKRRRGETKKVKSKKSKEKGGQEEKIKNNGY